jgi:PAS domain S-box-containing protein
MTLLLAGVICAIFVMSLIEEGLSPIVPWPATALSVATVAASVLGLFNVLKKNLREVALASFLLLSAASAIILANTGVIDSPFIALWMLLSVFAGMFGLYGLLPLFLAANGYLAYQFAADTPLSNNELMVFLLAAELPLVVSYIIWHRQSVGENARERAVSELSEELSQVSDQSEIVINGIADGVVAIDGKGTVRLINPAALKILGWESKDAMGLDYHSVLVLLNKDGKQAEKDADPIYEVFNTGKSVLNENLSLSTHSGKKLSVSLLVSPAGQSGQGAVVVFRDITKQKEEEREQAEFISTASHEMRTPVAAIEGYLGLAMNPATAVIDEKARTYLAKAHESAEHLGRLFQDLLDISRIEDGRLKNAPKAVDVVAFCGELTAGFAQKAADKQLALMFKPSQDADDPNKQRLNPVFYVMADKDHLREVVSNLLDNAIKYTKEGVVEVDVVGDEEQVTISVTDSGIGIPPEDVPHLFQKFYRVDSSDTREIGGTGLGLYLSRRLVENMNGRVWVESKVQKGSTFLVSLPRLSEAEVQTAREKEAQAKPGTPAAMPAIGQLPSNMKPPAAGIVQPQTPAPAPTPAPTPATVAPPAQSPAQPPVPTQPQPPAQPPAVPTPTPQT